MRKKILLIEDNQAVRENTSEILELAGYQVSTAANGRLGVESAQKSIPDLIVCDIMMPELDGYGVLHMLGNNPHTATVPFIFLTAKAERADQRKGMELGADDYITKPFDDLELLNAVERRLKKHDFMQQAFSHQPNTLDDFLSQARGLEELERLNTEVRVRTYRKKEIVYREGDPPSRLFFIQMGKVKTFKSDDSGKELITGLYTKGDYLGYTALLESVDYNDTAETLEPSEIREIPRQDFETLMFSNIAVSKKFTRMLANDVLEKEEQLLNLAYSSVRKRVADALLLLQSRYQNGPGPAQPFKIKREDLANIVGTATESVVRTLSDFKQEELIDITGAGIVILNERKLAQIRW